jgi:hypothetical protein
MSGNDKAFLWSCNDYSEEQVAIEKLAVRLQSVENATKFKEAFLAARTFNKLYKDGKESEAVMAPLVEDEPEEEEGKKEEVEKKDEKKE